LILNDVINQVFDINHIFICNKILWSYSIMIKWRDHFLV